MAEIPFPEIGAMNITQIMDGFYGANTNDIFFPFLLFAVFILLFALTLFLGFKTASMVSSFITVIFTLFFVAMGLVSWENLIAWGAIMILAVVYQFIG